MNRCQRSTGAPSPRNPGPLPTPARKQPPGAASSPCAQPGPPQLPQGLRPAPSPCQTGRGGECGRPSPATPAGMPAAVWAAHGWSHRGRSEAAGRRGGAPRSPLLFSFSPRCSAGDSRGPSMGALSLATGPEMDRAQEDVRGTPQSRTGTKRARGLAEGSDPGPPCPRQHSGKGPDAHRWEGTTRTVRGPREAPQGDSFLGLKE